MQGRTGASHRRPTAPNYPFRLLPFAAPMASSLDLLSAEIDRLIDVCRNLADDNAALRQEREEWLLERKRLVERNELARDRIETMIVRLKALEDGR